MSQRGLVLRHTSFLLLSGLDGKKPPFRRKRKVAQTFRYTPFRPHECKGRVNFFTPPQPYPVKTLIFTHLNHPLVLKRSFVLNLLLVLAIVAGLLIIFFQSLNWLTNHGKETKVPKLTGKTMREAVNQLTSMGFSVVIDSAFQADHKPLEVIYQEPEPGAVVKMGRNIFLTVNRKTVPTVAMPNLVNLSFRNALLTMQSYRLVMGDTSYRPDIAAGAVLEQLYQGRVIRPGELIPYGTRIDLVIGEGLADITDVPNLIGMSWFEARQSIEALSLSYNVLWEGEITDSNAAVVYKQEPEALNELDFKNAIPVGDMIDVYVMQNPGQDVLDRNQPGSGKLVGSNDSMGFEPGTESLPSRKKDSIKKRVPVPGTAAPSVQSSKAAGTKIPAGSVSAGKKEPSATTKKPNPVKRPDAEKKPEPPKKQGPPKSQGTDISNEFE